MFTGWRAHCYIVASCLSTALHWLESSISPTDMFRIASRPFASRHGTRGALATRLFHRITTDFVTHDTKGNQVTEKVPAVICNPGESYVMIEPRVGNALRAASPSTASSPGPAGDKCKLKFFHDSRHFASGKLTSCEIFIAEANNWFNPRRLRLSTPSRPSRDASPNRARFQSCNSVFERRYARDSPRRNSWWYGLVASPSLRILTWYVDLAEFSEHAHTSAKNLAPVLEQLKDMWRQSCLPCNYIRIVRDEKSL